MTQHNKPTVAVMMSGGVDSSVTAALLLEAGFHVEGFTLQTCTPSDADDERVYVPVRDARKVCDKLGIPHHIVDVTERFRHEIIGRFEAEYLAGLTPNPCIHCNPKIKWGVLWDTAKQSGMQMVATGHYVRLERDPDGTPHLRCGMDPNKDQSYFLWQLPAHVLRSTLFPLGGWEKPVTRQKARELKLPVAEKSESQEVCFLFDSDYRNWLARRNPEIAAGVYAGEMVDKTGKRLGSHNGFPMFTIGQRKGLGLGGGKLMFVTGIDPATKQVIIGDRADLLSDEFSISLLNKFFPEPLADYDDLSVKIRYRSKAAPARVVAETATTARIKTLDPVESVTPGQAAVIYRGDEVIGGGVIEREK